MILPSDGEVCLTIGGLVFRVRSGGFPTVFQTGGSYNSFITGEPVEGPLVLVRILGERMPSLEGSAKIFDSEETWSLYRDGEALLAAFRGGPGTGSPYLWIARVDVAGRRVDVFCGSPLVREREGGKVILNPLTYPLDQILVMIFLYGEGFTTHAAGALVDGRALIFPGVSGAGKTTVTRLLAEDTRFGMLSDDRVVLREMDGVVHVFGTPWPGDANVAENAEGPLTAILFLSKGKDAAIRPLAREEALRRLLPVASIPWYDRDITEASLSFCERLLDAVPAFELGFRLDSPVADLVGEFASTL
jgi:hypothetical protein